MPNTTPSTSIYLYASQWLCILFCIAWVLHLPLTEHVYLGAQTRDSFDHIALLDHWGITNTIWNYPAGGQIIPPDIFSMIFALPWLWISRSLAYNMAICTHCVCNAVAGWYLGKTVQASPFVCAISIALSPYMIGQINSGETETLALWGLIFSVAFLHQKRWRIAGVWMTCTAIASWYYGAYIAIIAFCWVGYELIRYKNTDSLHTFLVAGLGTSVPAYIYYTVLESDSQMFRGPDMHTYITDHPRALTAFSSDPSYWFSEVPVDANHIDSLGWVYILVAGMGIFRFYRTNIMWLWLIILGLVMSLGPQLHLEHTVVWDIMPYDILLQIPFFDAMRLPHRWLSITSIGLSVYIAMVANMLAKDAAWIFVLLLVGETQYFFPNITNFTLVLPSILSEIHGPLLDLPTRTMLIHTTDMSNAIPQDARGRHLVMQRWHHQPIPYSLLMQGWSTEIAENALVIATTALDSKDPISKRPIESQQFRQAQFSLAVADWLTIKDSDKREKLVQATQELQSIGIQHVCLHLDLLEQADIADIVGLLEQYLGNPTLRTESEILWNL